MEKIIIKTPEEIKIMRQGGRILAMILKELSLAAKPGVSTVELNDLAEDLIEKNDALPAFKNYRPSADDSPFPTTLCTSINREVVHAPAFPARLLRDGDVLCLDLGLKYPADENGLFVDAAITVGIGGITPEAKKLIETTRQSLEIGISQVKEGNTIQDIAEAVQAKVEKAGFSVVRDLVGHGVGKRVHEPPRIPNFWDGGERPVELKEGMTICIEPMVCAGSAAVRTKRDDGWTVETVDCSLAAHFEHTIAVTKDGYEILTKL